MGYISKCSDEQIKELMKCYTSIFDDISIDRRDGFIEIELIVDGIPESYTIEDYSVTVYDWDDTGFDYLKNYRKKMLEWFGSQYAIDYLLKN